MSRLKFCVRATAARGERDPLQRLLPSERFSYELSATSRYRNVGVQSTCARCPTRVSPRAAIRGEIAAGPELRSTEAVSQSAGANRTDAEYVVSRWTSER